MKPKEHKETIAGANSDPQYLDGWHPVSVTFIPVAGSTGKIQISTSPYADVVGGTAVWQDWALGVVAATQSDVLLGPVTAARLVKSSGAQATWELKAVGLER